MNTRQLGLLSVILIAVVVTSDAYFATRQPQIIVNGGGQSYFQCLPPMQWLLCYPGPSSNTTTVCTAAISGSDTSGTASPCPGLCSNSNVGTETVGTEVGCAGICTNANSGVNLGGSGCGGLCNYNAGLGSCTPVTPAYHINFVSQSTAMQMGANRGVPGAFVCTGQTTALYTPTSSAKTTQIHFMFSFKNNNNTSNPWVIEAVMYSGSSAPATTWQTGHCALGTARIAVFVSSYGAAGGYMTVEGQTIFTPITAVYFWTELFIVTGGAASLSAAGFGTDISALELSL